MNIPSKIIASTLFVFTELLPCGVALADEVSDGEKVYHHWCESCHAPGIQSPGTQALAARYKGGVPAALIERKDLTPDMVKFFVRNGISIMPFFRKTEISDAELNNLAKFLSKK